MMYSLITGGKISSSSSGSESKSTPKSPLRKLTRLFRRQTSEPAVSGSNKGVDSSQIFGRGLSDICHPDLPRPITVRRHSNMWISRVQPSGLIRISIQQWNVHWMISIYTRKNRFKNKSAWWCNELSNRLRFNHNICHNQPQPTKVPLYLVFIDEPSIKDIVGTSLHLPSQCASSFFKDNLFLKSPCRRNHTIKSQLSNQLCIVSEWRRTRRVGRKWKSLMADANAIHSLKLHITQATRFRNRLLRHQSVPRCHFGCNSFTSHYFPHCSD